MNGSKCDRLIQGETFLARISKIDHDLACRKATVNLTRGSFIY